MKNLSENQPLLSENRSIELAEGISVITSTDWKSLVDKRDFPLFKIKLKKLTELPTIRLPHDRSFSLLQYIISQGWYAGVLWLLNHYDLQTLDTAHNQLFPLDIAVLFQQQRIAHVLSLCGFTHSIAFYELSVDTIEYDKQNAIIAILFWACVQEKTEVIKKILSKNRLSPEWIEKFAEWAARLENIPLLAILAQNDTSRELDWINKYPSILPKKNYLALIIKDNLISFSILLNHIFENSPGYGDFLFILDFIKDDELHIYLKQKNIPIEKDEFLSFAASHPIISLLQAAIHTDLSPILINVLLDTHHDLFFLLLFAKRVASPFYIDAIHHYHSNRLALSILKYSPYYSEQESIKHLLSSKETLVFKLDSPSVLCQYLIQTNQLDNLARLFLLLDQNNAGRLLDVQHKELPLLFAKASENNHKILTHAAIARFILTKKFSTEAQKICFVFLSKSMALLKDRLIDQVSPLSLAALSYFGELNIPTALFEEPRLHQSHRQGSNLSSLPKELLQRIAYFLEPDELKQLAATSFYIRYTLKEVFFSDRFENTLKLQDARHKKKLAIQLLQLLTNNLNDSNQCLPIFGRSLSKNKFLTFCITFFLLSTAGFAISLYYLLLSIRFFNDGTTICGKHYVHDLSRDCNDVFNLTCTQICNQIVLQQANHQFGGAMGTALSSLFIGFMLFFVLPRTIYEVIVGASPNNIFFFDTSKAGDLPLASYKKLNSVRFFLEKERKIDSNQQVTLDQAKAALEELECDLQSSISTLDKKCRTI